MQSGGGVIPGNGTNVAGTLTISNGLTEAGGVVNYFDLSDDPTGTTKTNDLINVIGNLTLSGTNTIPVNMLNGQAFDWHLSVDPVQRHAERRHLQSHRQWDSSSLSYLTNLPGQIALVVLSTRAPTNITWAGGAGNNWDTGVSSNWLNGATLDLFYPFDSVTFDDSGSSSPPVNLVGALTPGFGGGECHGQLHLRRQRLHQRHRRSDQDQLRHADHSDHQRLHGCDRP